MPEPTVERDGNDHDDEDANVVLVDITDTDGVHMAAFSWMVFRAQLAQILRVLEDDQFLVLSDVMTHHYVQFAGSDHGIVRAEARSNQWIEDPSELLTAKQYARMADLGWNAPTYIYDAKNVPQEGGPNFYLDFPDGADPDELALLALRTFCETYESVDVVRLRYEAFSNSGNQFIFPGFIVHPHILRENADA